MTTSDTIEHKKKWRPTGWKGWAIVLILGMGTGYVVGAVAAKTGVDIEPAVLQALGTSGIVALAIGVLYAIIGLILFGATSMPKFGQNLLTGPDAQDLIDARPLYFMQSIAVALLGFALIVIALTGPGLAFEGTTGGIGFLLLFLAGMALWLRSLPLMDELVRTASWESTGWTYGLLVLFGGGWAVLAHIGFAAEPAALDWLSMFWGLALIGSTIAAVKRGMLAES